MKQADFSYGQADAPLPVPRTVAVGWLRPRVRQRVLADVAAVGADCIAFAGLDESPESTAGVSIDVIILDCPSADAGTLAALSCLDVIVAQAGMQLIVWTSVEALDAIFGCLDQSGAQILIDPTPDEHVIALLAALSKKRPMRVCELTGDMRQTLLRMSEQVSEIAARLDQVAANDTLQAPATLQLEAPGQEFKGEGDASGESGGRARAMRPPLPDPRLVRQIIAQRKLRSKFFGEGHFADPAWDILLDLTAARAEHERVSVTSLCIASNVPLTTALRWIRQMTDAGLLERVQDDADKRRAFISMSDKAADAMARYFAALGKTGTLVI